jgi:acetyltransferase-like isoleucine patch superfamily enzyme
MTGPRFAVIAPQYESDESGFEVPKLSELSPRLSAVLRLFVDPEAQVHQIWYPMVSSGDADLVACKGRFQTLAQEFPKMFPMMSNTERMPDSDLHPALNDLSSVHFYGGWKRRFDDSAKLRGPIRACTRVTFRSSCKVLGPSILEAKVTIGTSAIVNRSIVCARTEIDAGAQVGDSFIGRDVYIGPAVLLLHKPLTGKLDALREGVRLTNRPKCGVVVGDGCRIGAGARIEPGTILMPGCVVPINKHLPTGIYTPEDFR